MDKRWRQERIVVKIDTVTERKREREREKHLLCSPILPISEAKNVEKFKTITNEVDAPPTR